MRQTDHDARTAGAQATATASGFAPARPRWADVLRALREARGATQAGWGARLNVSRRTVQRWEEGERAPDPGAVAALVAYCREAGLFRAHARGPLAGLDLTPELLQELLAGARGGPLRATDQGARPAGGAPPSVPTAAPLHRGASHDPPPVLPSNLPAALTSFVGRAGELAAVRRALGATRLLTLTGAGGCGKTRLAFRVAGELLWAYPHGVWVVELAALADPALVPRTVAAALALQPTGPQPPVDALKESLRPRRLLLVLDNCEHLLAACAALVEALLRACPHLEVLATSREPLGLGGEAVWPVPPLALPPAAWEAGAGDRPERPDSRSPLPDSVRLFVERARLHRPGFALTAANAAAVAAVCRRLDGIPLALELAAARVRVLAPAQIAARLDDRFRLLTGGSHTAPPRHQTLRAALDWSHDLLTAPEQALLRRLAVFAGGFPLEAAEAVCSMQWAVGSDGPADTGGTAANAEGRGLPTAYRPLPTDQVLDLLTQLVDKSLVVPEEYDGAVRYGVLETVRHYAGERLDDAGESAVVRGRHLHWCLALAEAAEAAYRGPREAAWLARLELEHDNLRAALGWAVPRATAKAPRLAGALAYFWRLRGHVQEGRNWLAQALAAGEGEQAPGGVRAKALDGAGMLAELQGDYAAARTQYERSVRLHRQLGDEQGVAWTQGALGRCLFRQGDYAGARALLEASLALHEKLGHQPGIASARGALGVLALRQGDHAAARALLESRLAITRALGNQDAVADTLDDLATLAREQGDHARQVALLKESLALQRALGNRSGVAMALGGLGMATWARGEHGRARALLQESLALYREVGDPRGIAMLLGYQSMVALYAGHHPRAETLSRECVALYREVGDAWALGRFLTVLAAATFGLGQAARAARLFGAAAALRARLGTPLPRFFQADYDRTIAALRAALGERALTAAWAAGEALSLEEATAEALSEAVPA